MSLFGNKRDKEHELEIVDKELSIYKREGMLRVDQEVTEYRRSLQSGTEKNLRDNLKQLGENEHEYHSAKQKQEVELVRLEGEGDAIKAEIKAGRETLKRAADYDDAVAEAASQKARADAGALVSQALREEVARLSELLQFVAGFLPKVELDKIGVTINADMKIQDKTSDGAAKK